MVERSPEFLLIPPGIDDARTRALQVVFAKAASEFDFKSLLMRTSAEIPTAFLPHAIYERGVGVFFPPDGLPEPVARNLVDNAFDLKEMVGTDPGVLFGLSLLGLKADITQWWQEDPPGHHDTHRITVWANEQLYEGDDVVISERTIRAAGTMIEATKRKSQDTVFDVGVSVSAAQGIVGFAVLGDVLDVAGIVETEIAATMAPGFVGVAVVGDVLDVMGVLQ